MNAHKLGWRNGIEMISVLLALCRGIRRSTVDSLHKGPVTRDFDAFFVVSPKNCWQIVELPVKGQ